MKDRWDKISLVINWGALVGIPLLVAWLTSNYQEAQTSEAERRLWVQIGIDILRDKDADQGVRAWAVQVINANSEFRVEDAAASKLAKGEWTLPKGDFWKRYDDPLSFIPYLQMPPAPPQTAPMPNYIPPSEVAPSQ